MKFKRQAALATRFTTKIEKFINAIPTRETGLPRKPMSGWQHLPLYQKLPMYRTGRTTIFARRKLGEKLWKSSARGFVNDDLNFQFGYEPLHDPHLKHFFYRAATLRQLRRNGLIGDDNKPICSLRDFNFFRSYLRYHHVQKMKVAKEYMSIKHSKRRVYQHILSMAKREVRELKKQLESEKDESIRKFIYNALRHDIIFKYFKLYEMADTEAELFDIIHYDDSNKIHIDKSRNIHKIKKHCLSLKDKERLKQLEESVSGTAIADPLPSRLGEMAEKRNKDHDRYVKMKKAKEKHFQAKMNLIATYDEKMKRNSRLHYKVHQQIWEDLEAKRKAELIAARKRLQEEKAVQSIYNAKIILDEVLNSVRSCFSEDKDVLSYVMDRVKETGEVITFHYVAAISSIMQITQMQDRPDNSESPRRQSSTRSITFTEADDKHIGKTATLLDSDIELKSAAERTPTPIPSLETLMAVVQQTPKKEDKKTLALTSHIKKARIKHLKKKDKIFLEHCLIQFRRIVFQGVKEYVHARIDFEFGKMPRHADAHDMDDSLVKKVAIQILKTQMKEEKVNRVYQKFISIVAKNVLAGLKADQKATKAKMSEIKDSLKQIE